MYFSSNDHYTLGIYTFLQVQTTTSNCSGSSRRGLNTRLYEHLGHDIQHVWPDDESKCF